MLIEYWRTKPLTASQIFENISQASFHLENKHFQSPTPLCFQNNDLLVSVSLDVSPNIYIAYRGSPQLETATVFLLLEAIRASFTTSCGETLKFFFNAKV